MRGFKRAVVLVIGLALPTFLVACGVTETGGTSAGANPSPGTTVVVNGTPGTVHAVSSTTPSPSPGSVTPVTSGKVTLVLDKTSYAPSSAAIVTIENGLGSKIVVTDHHTSCTYVQLQQQVAGQWQPVGQCKLMTPTRLVELAAGSVTPQRIVIPAGSQAAGTYRVALTYNNTTTYSSTFAVE
jgi:hypothetical protein